MFHLVDALDLSQYVTLWKVLDRGHLGGIVEIKPADGIRRRPSSDVCPDSATQRSELHDLERQLEEIDTQDAKNIGDEDAQKAARLWMHYANDMNDQALARRKLHAEIKVKIREYHEAMILESQVLALNAPSSRTVRDFRNWFKSKSIPVLWGRDEHLFENENDLVALAPVDTDRLNLFLKSYFAWFFKESSPRDALTPKSELFYFPERRIQRAGALISVFLSAILLIGAIVCLTAVSDQSTSIRVGMIVLFTCFFAAVVGLLTNARRAEIFGSTAAYAAVLVVFVSNNLGGGKM